MLDRPKLTAERLQELLTYDPDEGRFTWALSHGKRVRIGQRVCGGAISGKSFRFEKYILTIRKPRKRIRYVVGIDERQYRVGRLAWL